MPVCDALQRLCKHAEQQVGQQSETESGSDSYYIAADCNQESFQEGLFKYRHYAGKPDHGRHVSEDWDEGHQRRDDDDPKTLEQRVPIDFLTTDEQKGSTKNGSTDANEEQGDHDEDEDFHKIVPGWEKGKS